LPDHVGEHWEELAHLMIQRVTAFDVPDLMPDQIEKLVFGEEIDGARRQDYDRILHADGEAVDVIPPLKI
jgi:hypothetical protein